MRAHHFYNRISFIAFMGTVGGALGLGPSAAAQPPVPDLEVSAISFSSTPRIGVPVTASATLKNIGGANTGIFTIQWKINGVETGLGGHGNLAPLQTSIDNIHHTFTPTGSFTIEYIADPFDSLTELNESNNRGSRTVTLVVPKPDLSAGPISFSGTPRVGQTITVNSSIANIGAAPSPAIPIRWVKNGVGVLSTTIAPLSNGDSTGVSYTWTPTSVGSATFVFEADAGNTIAESNESNNNRSATVNVEPAFLPDLSAGSISFNGTPRVGETVTVSSSVSNIGNAPSPAIPIRWVKNGAEFSSTTLAPLSNGDTTGTSVSWTPTSPGSTTFVFEADAGNSIAESNEGNNNRSTTVTVESVSLPDLVAGTINLSGSPRQGETVTLSATVQNNGNTVSPAVPVEWRVNGSLLHATTLAPLGNGDSTSTSHPWTPGFAGAAAVQFRVDPGAIIAESNEGNNDRNVDVTVAGPPAPDLRAVDISVSPAPERTLPTTVTGSYVNDGDQVSPSIPIRILIDGVVALSQTMPALSPGAGASVSHNWTPDRLGNVEIILETDAGNTFVESNEANNNRTESFTVVEAPVTQRLVVGNGLIGCDRRLRLPVLAENLEGVSVSAFSFDLIFAEGALGAPIDVRPAGLMKDWSVKAERQGIDRYRVTMASSAFPDPRPIRNGEMVELFFEPPHVPEPPELPLPVLIDIDSSSITGIPDATDGVANIIALGVSVVPRILIGDAVATIGRTVEIPVSIRDLCFESPFGFPLPHSWFELEFTLDDTGLDTPSASLAGTVIPGWTIVREEGVLDSYQIDASAEGAPDLVDGTFLWLTIPVKVSAAPGTYEISLRKARVQGTGTVIVSDPGVITAEEPVCPKPEDTLWTWAEFEGYARAKPAATANRDCVAGHYSRFAIYDDRLEGTRKLLVTPPLTYETRGTVASLLTDVITPPDADPTCNDNVMVTTGWVSFARWGNLLPPETGADASAPQFSFTTRNFTDFGSGSLGRIDVGTEYISEDDRLLVTDYFGGDTADKLMLTPGGAAYTPNYPEPSDEFTPRSPDGLIRMPGGLWRTDARNGRRYLNAPFQRRDFVTRTDASNRLIWTELSTPVHLPGSIPGEPDQTGIYAANCSGTIAIGKRFENYHSTFWGGAHVRGAGELNAVDGELCFITNESGHYLPSREQFERFLDEQLPTFDFEPLVAQGVVYFAIPKGIGAECRAAVARRLPVAVSPTRVTLRAGLGDEVDFNIGVTNYTDQPIHFRVVPDSDWLTVDSTNPFETAYPGTTADNRVVARCGGTAGTFSGTIRVRDNDSGARLGNPIRVELTCSEFTLPSGVVLKGPGGTLTSDFVLENRSATEPLVFAFRVKDSVSSVTAAAAALASSPITFVPDSGVLSPASSQKIEVQSLCPADPGVFDYVVEAVLGDASIDVSVRVSCNVNGPPVATRDGFAFYPSAGLLEVPSPGLLANDTDPDADVLEAVVSAEPRVGTLTVRSDGSFTYLPEPGFNGVAEFAYRVSDGFATSDEARVTLNHLADCDRTLYGIDTADDWLVFLDPATGAVTPIGPLGIDVTDIDIDFDHLGRLWAFSDDPDSADNRLSFRIDPLTGRATNIRAIPIASDARPLGSSIDLSIGPDGRTQFWLDGNHLSVVDRDSRRVYPAESLATLPELYAGLALPGRCDAFLSVPPSTKRVSRLKLSDGSIEPVGTHVLGRTVQSLTAASDATPYALAEDALVRMDEDLGTEVVLGPVEPAVDALALPRPIRRSLSVDAKYDRETGLSRWVVRTKGHARHVSGCGNDDDSSDDDSSDDDSSDDDSSDDGDHRKDCGSRGDKGFYRLFEDGAIDVRLPTLPQDGNYRLRFLVRAKSRKRDAKLRVTILSEHARLRVSSRDWQWSGRVEMALPAGEHRLRLRAKDIIDVEAVRLEQVCAGACR